jgi:hypothetical protein
MMGHPETVIAAAGSDRGPLAPGTRLPVARYRFTVRLRADLTLPEFSGSLLRGQFGAALRRSACITRAKSCEGCPLLATCPYPAIFETPAPADHPLQKFSAVPNPYVIEPPPLGTRFVAAGESLSFGMVLVGRALDQLPLIVYALQRAFGRGIGPQRAAGDLEDIVYEDADGEATWIWDRDAARVLPHAPRLVLPSFGVVRQARLAIDTPLRLQENSRPLHGRDLSPRRLVTALVRRAALLFEFHAGRPGFGAGAGEVAHHAEQLAQQHDLAWHDWTRYSSRQRQAMTLGGVLGTWTLHGDLAPLVPWLWLGQWLHVGKNATMGMGAYRLTLGCPESFRIGAGLDTASARR